MANKLNQWRSNKRYAAKLNLLAKVHRAIEPQLEKARQAFDYLENRRKDFAGYVTNHADGHYSNDVYQLADSTRQEPADLASLNDSRFALLVRAQELNEQARQERLKGQFD